MSSIENSPKSSFTLLTCLRVISSALLIVTFNFFRLIIVMIIRIGSNWVITADAFASYSNNLLDSIFIDINQLNIVGLQGSVNFRMLTQHFPKVNFFSYNLVNFFLSCNKESVKEATSAAIPIKAK